GDLAAAVLSLVPRASHGAILSRHFAPNSKVTFAGVSATTVSWVVLVPKRSCHASSVYLPAGTLGIVNEPSSPVTAKNGWLEIPTYAVIQGWTSHLNLRTEPVSLNFLAIGGKPGISAWLKIVEGPRYACTLCSV